MKIGLGIGIPFIRNYISSLFDPSKLFTGSTNGAWYDPSDITTLYRDAAGTLPVTAVEQPVGLMLDKSKNGVGTNGAKRVNLLTKTEQFDDAVWNKNTATVSATKYTDPNGTTTANLLYPSSSGSDRYIAQNIAATASAIQVSFSVYVKSAGKTCGFIYTNSAASYGICYFDLADQTTQVVAGSVSTPTISLRFVGNGWFKVTFTSGSAISYNGTSGSGFGVVDAKGSTAVTASGTNGLYIWGADLRLASEASTLPTYQKITDTWYNTLPGNHAFNSSGNSANFPVLSARKNKLLATAALATQNVTVRAVGHVLSFWGTGTITLSGASTAGPLVGTGAGNRVYLEFTPTAGTLTLTVSGSVLKAQLEEINETV